MRPGRILPAPAPAVLLAVALPLAGCASGDPPQAIDPAPSGAAPSAVTGTVSYRERVALPDDAIVDLWISDVTPGLATAAVVTAETSFPTNGRQVPIPFTLEVDPSRVAPDHDYALHGVIRADGRELFAADPPAPVLTHGKGWHVDLRLTRVRGAPAGTGGDPGPPSR